ncbi:MAG TPA: GNAT family N-acetyltransferase [Candidatus Eremiobacteraceae bacterium]
MTAPVIRRAIPADGPIVRGFVFQALLEFGLEVDRDGHDLDVMSFGESKEGVLEFVAELDGRPVGSVIVTPRDDGSANLSKYYVDSACRGRGIGRPLLEFAVNAARAAGLRRLELDTRPVFHAAIHLYEAMGWTSTPPPATAGRCELYYTLDL